MAISFILIFDCIIPPQMLLHVISQSPSLHPPAPVVTSIFKSQVAFHLSTSILYPPHGPLSSFLTCTHI